MNKDYTTQTFEFFENIPQDSQEEIFQTLLSQDNVRVERIISYGQTTPEDFWYDQAEDEMVMVLKGEAKILYEDGMEVSLQEGSFLIIPAHKKHQVTYTHNLTIWLAIFFL
jgi:cupin 2 domain-containing protein